MIDRDEDGTPGTFLARWSRRKRGLDEAEQADSSAAAPTAADASPGEDGAPQGSAEATEGGEPQVRDFSDFDFESLDYESDYTQFMGKDVTSDARHKALRKLWVSNPVLANMDGLDDYCEDYTDAAVCLPKGVMKTAYQYGRGFLSDEEVAEWEALGRPAAEEGEASGRVATDGSAPDNSGEAIAAVATETGAGEGAVSGSEAGAETADGPSTDLTGEEGDTLSAEVEATTAGAAEPSSQKG